MLLSLRFNGHFSGGLGLADTRLFPFWMLLKLRMMEVVVTTVAIRQAKLKQTNIQLLTRPDVLPVTSVRALKDRGFQWLFNTQISIYFLFHK